MNKGEKIKTYTDLLQLDDFILWRLVPTEEQDRRWQAFRQEHPELGDEIDKAITVCDNIRICDRAYAGTDDLYRRIRRSIAMAERRRRRLYRYLSAAASVLVLVGMATLYYYMRPVSRDAVQTGEIVGTIGPSQDVLLVTGSGTTRIRGNAMLQLDGGRINVLDSANQVKETTKADVQYNKLVVPYGRRSSIALGDGSRLWVNSGSEVSFPSEFGREKREIRVNGEIFIDVAKSRDWPFVVHTSAFDVTVRGTRFNLSAYDKEGAAAVVLVQGRVEVSTPNGTRLSVNPSEMARLDGHGLAKQHVETSHYTSWVDGVYIFDKTPVAEVLRSLGKYYNITFDNTAVSLAGEYISGKVYLSDNIDDVLTSVSLITSTTYTRSRQTVKLTKTTPKEE